MSARISNIQTETDFYEHAFRWVVDHIHQTLATQEDCRIGLSGGSTPKKLYAMLNREHLDWEKIILIGIDERYVPITDKASNAGMIRNELTSAKNFFHFDTNLGYLESALSFEQKLFQLKRAHEPLFDLLIFGAGHDGHIASIFPDSQNALRKGFLTAQTETDVFDIRDRLTVTMEALTNCGNALLLLKGSEKHEIVKMLEQGDTETPVGKFAGEVEMDVVYVA